jgi:hypothetical protein
MVGLFFDPQDARVPLLQAIGARSVEEAGPGEAGFLFSRTTSVPRYDGFVGKRPLLLDRPADRWALLDPIGAWRTLERTALPRLRTWIFDSDSPHPVDLVYPLALSTSEGTAQVTHPSQLDGAIEGLVRESREIPPIAVPLIAREIGVEESGVWAVDGTAYAWEGARVVEELRGLASQAARLFRSRCVVVEFAKTTEWRLKQVVLGSAALAMHVAVFQAVARRLAGAPVARFADGRGGLFE